LSTESSVMVQISQHCHASITHPMLHTKGAGRLQPIVAAAEWYTRRRDDTYRNSPMDTPLYQPFGRQVSQYLHSSSPQNFRKSGDMWGFSTENNQPVQSFDDPQCLICPIGHVGCAQVDIAKAVLGCWGRTRHLPEPRPDLVKFQEQTKAIHIFLSNPEAVNSLEERHLDIHSQQSTAPFKSGMDYHLIEFTNGHVQLNWEKGSWIVRDWNAMETHHSTWIQPEENLLSALIRAPSRPESVDQGPNPVTERNIQEQTTVKQEWPHPNTATMIEYLGRMEWKTPFLRRLRSINMQWKIAIDSMEIKSFDFSSCCQGGIQPRNSHRLSLTRDGRLVCHNRKAYGRLSGKAEWKPEQYIPDREVGPSGAQMLNTSQNFNLSCQRSHPSEIAWYVLSSAGANR